MKKQWRKLAYGTDSLYGLRFAEQNHRDEAERNRDDHFRKIVSGLEFLDFVWSFECTLAKMDKISYDINGLK